MTTEIMRDGPEGPQAASHGFFWDGPPPDEPDSSPITAREAALSDPFADKWGVVTLAKTFFAELQERSDRVNPLKLDGPISETEWREARSTQPSVVDQWFYEDVGCFIAPGGTGKTTLLLFQVIHIVLGRPLFGYAVTAPGPVVIITAEDSRETLVARLRQMCVEMPLTEEEIRTVREDIIITDVSGKGIKLTTVEKDVVMPSKALDKLIVEIGVLCPSLLVIDPMVSFGIGESRVNDSEQGLIDAARRIRNVVHCAVIYVHHTGKENARNRTTDQYSGRGGSALSDGARMIHVLQRLDAEEWTKATGDLLQEAESGFILARPKMTWCRPQPNIYLKRSSYTFRRYDHIGETEGAQRVNQIAEDKIWKFVADEWLAGRRHTQNTLQDAAVMPQKATRQTVARLLAQGRLMKEDAGGGRGGAHHFLRPCEVQITT
ncbi:AAA family ATPase [Brevundimonas vesicularis]|uniref:AAA family ATPase n=1 Tax=Brevundimonas vesicularis TaxID=41276 RepID=UPI0022AC7B07|nr:AAA family ATPase [Brevundimonas vesicularis]